jgi:aryl-alcohol dehydrogenase-like predicted oxidoreductase
MQYRKINKTEIEVSAIGMGCWAISGGEYWGEQDEAEAIAAIDEALDVGINFFDTAEIYGDGRSEELLGKAFANKRERAVIASKVSGSHLGRDDLRRACEGSLKRLRTDYIDLYQIHWTDWDTPIEETTGALEELKQEGKIRAIGVSNFGTRDMQGALAAGECCTNQLPYNLIWRAIEFEVLPACVENDVGILCYSPIMQGLLAGKYASKDDLPEQRARTRHFSGKRPLSRHGEEGCEEETFQTLDKIRQISEGTGGPMANVAMAWLLHQPGVASVLAGARNPDQIRRNAGAVNLELSADTIDELDKATGGLKRTLGRNADLWQSESRIR